MKKIWKKMLRKTKLIVLMICLEITLKIKNIFKDLNKIRFWKINKSFKKKIITA